MGCGLVLSGFLPSCHLLKSRTFKTIRTIPAMRKRIWKKEIIQKIVYACEVKGFDDTDSRNHTSISAPGKGPLIKRPLA